MPKYIVKFAPISESIYSYEVEAEDEVMAQLDATDDFRMDVGYDTSKDFECIAVEEQSDE
jgi:hypothetical protein